MKNNGNTEIGYFRKKEMREINIETGFRRPANSVWKEWKQMKKSENEDEIKRKGAGDGDAVEKMAPLSGNDLALFFSFFSLSGKQCLLLSFIRLAQYIIFSSFLFVLLRNATSYCFEKEGGPPHC